MEEVEMVDVFIAGVRWSVPQPVYESILATQAELAGQTERENGYEARIAELEEEVLVAQEIGEDIGRKGALDDVLALPVLIGNVIRISDIEALRGGDEK